MHFPVGTTLQIYLGTRWNPVRQPKPRGLSISTRSTHCLLVRNRGTTQTFSAIVRFDDPIIRFLEVDADGHRVFRQITQESILLNLFYVHNEQVLKCRQSSFRVVCDPVHTATTGFDIRHVICQVGNPTFPFCCQPHSTCECFRLQLRR